MWGLKNCTSPSTITNSSSTSAPTTSAPMRKPRRALKPRTLLSDHERDDRQRQQQRLDAVAQGMPEDLQVLRRRVGGNRDQDDVVEQDRPARDEADELVEGVAGEDRRAARFLVQWGPLDVGQGGQGRTSRQRARKTSGVSPSAWLATTPSEKNTALASEV